jgi:formylglycine-generating enzyme required for sulfatase activity
MIASASQRLTGGRRCGSGRLLSAVLILAAIGPPARAETPPPSPMVVIQPGSFAMGSPPTEPKSRIDEKQHRVTISRPFMLAATEVTKAAWVAVMGRDPCYFPDCDDCPVERVS